MRVLVLCHGNVNRSPFVAGLLRRLRPDWEVSSAGLKQGCGARRATPKARGAAERLGFSLEEHRSRSVTRADLAEADLVLYMDGGNARRLLAEWGVSARCLADWSPDDPPATRVPDPNYTSDPDELLRMFGIAEKCARRLAEEWRDDC